MTTDAYGCSGGIARCVKDFCEAMSRSDLIGRVVVVPRHEGGLQNDPAPTKVEVMPPVAGLGLAGFMAMTLRAAALAGPFDLIFCAHLHLLPFGRQVGRLLGAPTVVLLHGIEAWSQRQGLRGRLSDAPAGVIAVSQITLDRYLDWSRVQPRWQTVLHNPVRLSHFTPGPRDPALVARYGLAGRRVILTLGRIDGAERRKGFDEVLTALPQLVRMVPNLIYMIAGGGDGQGRLAAMVAEAGLSDHVVFTGFVPEAEKVEHYRLADAFVMPSAGEGFGYVLIEAAACGLPVVGSKVDGGREALLDGRLGRLVNPDDPHEVTDAVIAALSEPHCVRRPGLEYFDFDNYLKRCRLVFQAFRDLAGRT